MVAAGRGAEPGYDGLSGTPPSVAAEISRMALFLTTPAARHITGQTLHVSSGVLAQLRLTYSRESPGSATSETGFLRALRSD